MRSQHFFRWLLLMVFVATAAFSRQPATARADQGASSAAVVAWNRIAVRTIVHVATAPQPGVGAPPAHAFILLSYVQAAVYNAVVAIEGGYVPYHSSLPPQPDASLDAAVARAARDTLLYAVSTVPVAPPLTPAIVQTLLANVEADYVAALGGIADDQAKTDGIALGQAAAAEIIALRQGDGLSVPYAYPLRPAGPGVWVPPANGGLTPWVAVMRPFLMDNASQFRPGPPPNLNSQVWVRDYNEVIDIGRFGSPTRSAAQTQAALFWTDNPAWQNNTAFSDLIESSGLNAMQAARLYAMGNLVNADAAIACWDAKYHYQFWRPLQAIIVDSDGNPRTAADGSWTGLTGMPPHPEYPSGHGCVTSSLAGLLTKFLGTKQIEVDIKTRIAGVNPATRHFATADDLRTEIINVRVWTGIHYRNSDEVGARMGKEIANWALERHFQPTD